MRATHWLTTAIFGLVLTGCAAAQVAPSQDERQALTPTGKLRVCFLSTSPVHVARDPLSGVQTGVAIDVGNELARRLGMPPEWVGYRLPAEIESSAQSDQWDVCIFAFTPARAKLMDFSPPLLEVEVGYLVPAGSLLAALTEVDRPGVRIAVQAKTVVDTHLSASLKSARLLRVPSPADPIDLLAAGEADAFAHLKPFLVRSLEKLPSSRVLDGKIFSDQIAIAVPMGRNASMAYVRSFVEDLKSSGFVKDSVQRAGLRAVVVAPLQ